MTSVVLDASALIALLANEPGADVVRQHLRDAIVSAVNYGEVLKKTVERGGLLQTAEQFVRGVSVSIVDFGQRQAALSASIYPQTRHLGLSFADRACLSLGIDQGALVLTTEQQMAKVECGATVKLIRGLKTRK